MSKPDPVKHPINMSITHNNNSQPLYMLNNTIHPILDGVDIMQPQQQHETRMQQYGRSNSSQNNQNNEITIQRGWNSTILRSNSEFINDTKTHDDNKYSYHPETHTSMSSNIKDGDDTNNNHKVGGEGVNIKVKHEESSSSSSDKELNNLSDDENQEEFDESATEIPTLDTYVPREPSYDVANALPFKELCRRYVYSLVDYISSNHIGEIF